MADLCPTLRHIKQEDQCFENPAGLGSVAYIFLKEDLAAKLERVKDSDGRPTSHYAWPETAFKSGKGFYKVELRPHSQGITGENQKKRGMFKQTANLIIEVVNDAVSELCRGLNDLDWAFIIADGDDKWQIMYTANEKITLDAGALKTETGQAASDDRITTLAPVLENALFPCTWVDFPEGVDPEDLVAA